jgi:hypothetical protein
MLNFPHHNFKTNEQGPAVLLKYLLSISQVQKSVLTSAAARTLFS